MNSKINKNKKKERDSTATMTFIDHLDELRKRLIRFFAVLIVCVLATYFYRVEILDLIKKPIDIPLEKYTASSTMQGRSIQSTPGSGLETYNCVCEPVIAPAISSERAVVDATGDTGSGESAGQAEVEKVTTQSPEEENSFAETVTATIDDFVMYFQSLIGKTPTPIFRNLEQAELPNSQASFSSSSAEGGTIDLTCQCQVKTAGTRQGASMVYIGLPELFFTQMKVAVFAGLFLSLPYLLVELWGFIGPALYSGEKRMFWVFAVGSYIFFIGGALFGYFVVFPFGFDFFLSLTQMGEIMPSLSIGAYLGFTIKLLIAFGAIFELPLVVFILARLGVVTPGLMIKQSRIAIFAIFIMSAMLTPPDPFTMMLMAGPLIMLYIFSIGVCFVGLNRQKASLRAQGLDDEDNEE